MKVKYTQTQVQNDEIVAHVEGEVPDEEFDSIDEAAQWIKSWLEWKEFFLTNLGIRYERKGDTLNWKILDVIDVMEVLEVVTV